MGAVSKRNTPRGQRRTHSPQVRHALSAIGDPSNACRRTSTRRGQLKEQIPHWTQRSGSGTITLETRRLCFCAVWSKMDCMDISYSCGLIILAPVRVALHATGDIIRDSFFVVFFGQFRFIMTIEAGKTAGAGRMACCAFSIGALVVDRECVIEIGRKPTRRTVAIGALA